MGRTLVIVESPAKAKAIERFLGRSYKAVASMGHVRDLPRSQFGVDIEAGFEPKYITIRGKGKLLNQLRQTSRRFDRVLLATDPDREGEAIAWHLAQALELDPRAPVRVVFREITRDTVRNEVKQARPIDEHLVSAQQSRRILDRIVGYQLSPLLWRKVRRGLSAGRVQSVALRLICDREAEIQAFVPEEYWSLTATLRPVDTGRPASVQVSFPARYHGQGQTRRKLADEEQVRQVLMDLEGADYRVADVRRSERRRNPAAPFTTSTLQQEAARKLGFTVRRTMRAAQQLYEGIELRGEGAVGLITYMRTDSTRVSVQAVSEAASLIRGRFGDEYVKTRNYGATGRTTQDAHEAIRPTSVLRAPDEVKADLEPDQYRLYKLIWERFIASQMAPAVLDAVTADIEAAGHVFRATGSTVKFPGFMAVYVEGSDDEDGSDGSNLPELTAGEQLHLLKLEPRQHFTQPPPRYTEAMLVKALEEHGIGRPSTYAPIIETIQERGYVTRENRRFVPTELGLAVNQLLQAHFADIVDIEFTAKLEAELDGVEEGARDGRALLEDFYGTFRPLLERAEQEIARVQLPEEETDELCEKCGRNLVIKHGRFGRFLACPGYPECQYTRALLDKTGAECPQCGGDVVVRRSRKGRVFYGCANFPSCRFVTWHKPSGQSCPKCNAFMVERRTKARGAYLECSRNECGHTEDVATAKPKAAQGKAKPENGAVRSEPSSAEEALARVAERIVRSSVASKSD